MHRAPGFALGLIATLAVALGAATAIGAVVYGVMLRPLPYHDPERLVLISVRTPGLGVTNREHSAGTFVYLLERARSYSVLAAAMENKGVAITDGDSPERVAVALVTPSLFRALGTTPAAGRLFRDEDAVAGLESPSSSVMISGNDGWCDARHCRQIHRTQSTPAADRWWLPADFDYPFRAASIYYPETVTAERAGLTSRYLTVDGIDGNFRSCKARRLCQRAPTMSVCVREFSPASASQSVDVDIDDSLLAGARDQTVNAVIPLILQS